MWDYGRVAVRAGPGGPPVLNEPWTQVKLAEAAALSCEAVLGRLGVTQAGLRAEEAARRLAVGGPNALRTHQMRWWVILGRQLHSALLLLLLVTATISFFVGNRSDALIIGVILLVSVGLGFVNEYRAQLASEALHTQIRHEVVVRRHDRSEVVDVISLVPGDVVHLTMGAIVPGDVRVLTADGLECDESILTGESEPTEKSPAAVAMGVDLGAMSSCAFMGTIVHAGSGDAVVVATGTRTEFGRVALGLGERQEETEFQAGLRHFSGLLARVAGVLTTSIFVINVLLHRSLLESLLFSLAIAVGITPQLLPAVVTTSLATGSRRLARKKVLVKRLVCIEDLGDIEVLLTDKTGTLTEGHIAFERAIDWTGESSSEVFALGRTCTEATIEDHRAVGGNPLDLALWEASGAQTTALPSRLAVVPFDHDRRMTSVLVEDSEHDHLLVTKGAPENVLDRCMNVTDAARATLEAQFNGGSRVIAVATRSAPGLTTITSADERDLTLEGYLVFLDPPKIDAAKSLRRLADLGITVKVVTGDNAMVAAKICRDLDLEVLGTLTGSQIESLDDDTLRTRVTETTIFARVSPAQKARLVRMHRTVGRDVAFLGDGVNDAVALHTADVGISVESGADVAKDAADIVLLEKDLEVLAEGVAEGRRTFANTIKYVLMGTSSNFGNMFSAALASTFLSFLPMLPSQILLNNLLYDSSQMTIPTDLVDDEMLTRPSHWDLHFIRRFMLFFGPISSLFDFVTFAIMLWGFHSGPPLFRSGWFVESLATQTLVVFVIRTRRTPFWRSRPSRAMLIAVLTVVAIGAYLPYSPFAHSLGFKPLPALFFVALGGMVAAYLTLVEFAKRLFFERVPAPARPPRTHAWRHQRMVRRRVAHWTHHEPPQIVPRRRR
jgi:Mg2+-importing ATPase